MRLLFVHQNFGAFGGAEANIQITADELVRRGHTVGFLFTNETGRGAESWEQTFSIQFQLPGPGTPRLAARGELPQSGESRRRQAIESVLEFFEPDVVYLHTWPDVGVIESLLASRAPVIRMVHDHSLYCARSYKYNPLTRAICRRPASSYCTFPCMASITRNRNGRFPLNWTSLSNHRKELELSKLCERLIVYSEYSKTELVNNGFDAKKIHIHVPMRCWTDGPTSSLGDRNVILFAGQLIRGKGVDMLLKALTNLSVTFECLILGDGNHRPYCQRLCTRLNLGDRVQFRGYVPPEELQKFYLEASVFVVPSVWPEPFGMVGPEAMRYGLPVVAFDSGGIKEWLIDGENGFLVPRMDTRSFASRIDELLRNKSLARQMGAAGRERVNRVYSASSQVASLERIFLNVATKTGARTTLSASAQRERSGARTALSATAQPVIPACAAHHQELTSNSEFSAFPASNSVEALTHSTTADV